MAEEVKKLVTFHAGDRGHEVVIVLPPDASDEEIAQAVGTALKLKAAYAAAAGEVKEGAEPMTERQQAYIMDLLARQGLDWANSGLPNPEEVTKAQASVIIEELKADEGNEKPKGAIIPATEKQQAYIRSLAQQAKKLGIDPLSVSDLAAKGLGELDKAEATLLIDALKAAIEEARRAPVDMGALAEKATEARVEFPDEGELFGAEEV